MVALDHQILGRAMENLQVIFSQLVCKCGYEFFNSSMICDIPFLYCSIQLDRHGAISILKA